MRCLDYLIEDQFDGAEVGTVLRSKLEMGRRTIRHAKFVENGIRLDGQHARTVDAVHAGQLLQVVIGDSAEDVAKQKLIPVEGELDIIFEDEDFIILNKPAGMPTHPGPKHPDDTLGNIVMYYFQQTNQQCVVHPIHRLDWGTSGLVIFAKNGYTQDMLTRAFHTDLFQRSYLALCHGVPKQLESDVVAPIGMIEKIWEICPENEGGKYAKTHYRVLESIEIPKEHRSTELVRYFESLNEHPNCKSGEDASVYGQEEKNSSPYETLSAATHFDPRPSLYGSYADVSKASLIELILETGRTHQIRIHMSSIACPLYGDSLYGGLEGEMPRPALHSYGLHFIHPVTKQEMNLYAPLPRDLQNMLDKLHFA